MLKCRVMPHPPSQDPSSSPLTQGTHHGLTQGLSLLVARNLGGCPATYVLLLVTTGQCCAIVFSNLHWQQYRVELFTDLNLMNYEHLPLC